MGKAGVFVSMPPELKEKVLELAAKEHRSASNQCRYIVREVLAHLELCKKIGIIDRGTELPQPQKREVPDNWHVVMGGRLY